MVGQGVLRECLLDERVESVLVIGRKSTGRTHEKLREVVLSDMFDFNGIVIGAQHFDACFFCLGVTSAGLNEADYTRLTFDLTVGWARVLANLNRAMTFTYVSGTGTGGKVMWAQVKGRTENALLELFPNAYMFRLGALRAMHGEVSKTRWTRIAYVVTNPFLPLVRAIAPGSVVTTEELGRAMIRVAREGAAKHILENRDMIDLGKPS
jgi:hypothetical protein